MMDRLRRRFVAIQACRPISKATLTMLLALAACGPERPAERESGSGGPAGRPPAAVEATQAPVSEVGIAWRDYDVLHGAARSSADDLYVDLTNYTGVEQSGRLILVASGLNGQLARQPLRSFRAAPHSAIEVRIPVHTLPIQSEVSTSFAAVEAEVDRGPDDHLLISGIPIYYIFRNGYREAAFYEQSTAATQAEASVAHHDLRDVQGQMLQADGAWFDASTRVAASGRSAMSHQGMSRMRLIPRDQVLPRRQVFAPEDPSVNDGETLPFFASVCTNWRVAYNDVGRGEDFMTTAGWHDERASHAYVSIRDANTHDVVWDGYLNSGGCVGYDWPQGDYILTQYSDNLVNGKQILTWQNDGSANDERAAEAGEGDFFIYQLSVETAFTIDGFVGPYVLRPTASLDAVQAAAVAGRILVAEATLNGLGLQPGTYTIHANEDCGDERIGQGYFPGACCKRVIPSGDFDNDRCTRVVTGRSLVGGHKGAYWKHIIAHEMGHFVQNRAMRFPFREYNDEPVAPSPCNCHFMNDSWGIPGPLHCLQGREHTGAAQIEGFAHAFAGRVFNSNNETNGKFIYYKQYLPSGATNPVNPPTQGFNLLSSFFWEHTYCPLAGEAIEWDWMVFFYKIFTESASNPVTLQDIFSIYKRACGNPNANCHHATEVGYAQLRAAALAHYGNNPNNARFLRFVNAASQSGIVE